MARQLYELCGQDPARVFSPYCWRARMALLHKGLDFASVPWRFTETERLAFAQHDKVPVLVDGDQVIPDSWAIARHLDAAYPATPSLLHGRPEAYAFVIGWNDTVLAAGISRLIVSDIPKLLDPPQRDYFETTRTRRFGMPLEQVTAGREERLPAFRATLQPLRAALAGQPFLGGAAPDYADFVVFGSFMWARSTSPLRLLEPEDAIWAWRERMLDHAGGAARQAPCFGA
ncbi:glutathione S-transferase family protein [Falsiroseomonas selenitidurans]|uniref:Glutathione S-transferase family protein n=1 Tax=Falsiroseomonas selenitidurans TaxID=2716335 RepID=A0ABX1E4J7_9PROT|nr:glutathione S-transferase family protein [Falsiroseomonas selenitidurans]NKC32114.1 glutathione S-transferase family protein [Falsiroseomonas selenitidurans]